jgi:predicted membrane protein
MMMIPLFMTLLLLTTIASIFIYQRTNQEVHLVLAIFTAIIFLIWGLAIAHWSIHILALLTLFCIRIPVFSSKTVKIYEKSQTSFRS